MDATPCTSTSIMSPPKKRRQLENGHLSITEKQNIVNMFKLLKNDTPDGKIVSVVSTIGQTLGVANSTVYRVLKEYRQTGNVRAPKQGTGRPSMINGYDEMAKNQLRRTVHSFFFKNELPTLDKILKEVTESDLPQISRSTLYKLLRQINFKYMKRTRKSMLIERSDIIRWRRKYLTTIKRYRSENRPIYYLDETWLNEGHTKQKVWVDNDTQSRRQAFLEGLSTGLKNPSGKGRRLIILHIGSEFGFIDEAVLIFEGKKTSNYHEEMNATVFEEWFRKILPKLQDNAVIVMDNATYHSRKLEKIPTTSSKKKDMQDWLKLKNIMFDENMVRTELLDLIRLHKKDDLYATDEMARNQNKVVLRLPPYHCELNPIELIWAQIKNEVASKNKNFKLNEIKEHLLQAIKNVTVRNWKNCINHVIKEEDKMYKLDGIVDDLIEPFIIRLENDTDNSSENDSDSD